MMVTFSAAAASAARFARIAATIRRLLNAAMPAKTPPFAEIVMRRPEWRIRYRALHAADRSRFRQFCRLKGLIVTADAQNAIATLTRTSSQSGRPHSPTAS